MNRRYPQQGDPRLDGVNAAAEHLWPFTLGLAELTLHLLPDRFLMRKRFGEVVRAVLLPAEVAECGRCARPCSSRKLSTR